MNVEHVFPLDFERLQRDAGAQQLVTLLRIIDAEEFFHLVVAEGLGAHVRHRQFASR